MSKQAYSIRKVQPSRRELRDMITTREIARELRAQPWAEYLIETGRIYQ
ncbi:hypothetical protein [Mycolicibacterium septicum]|nr:hypothetical protein [Mycolicibacterium septicum]QRY51764.1 hypothetical protein JVX95_31060 [Mycolicibacterium septicum]